MSTSPERAFRDKNVLVTGGLGFIGSNLARDLLTLGAHVLLVHPAQPGAGIDKHLRGRSLHVRLVHHVLRVRRQRLRVPRRHGVPVPSDRAKEGPSLLRHRGERLRSEPLPLAVSRPQ